MKNFLFAFFVLSSSVVFSQKKESPENELQQTINNYLQQTIKENEIPSLAVGVVKDEKILFEGYYGKENAEGNNPINENSIFRIYSTSKLISTLGVFQLIEKGKLSLDDKISKYLENLPKEWKNVKIKNLLSHSSGIPNIIRYKDIPVTATDNEKITRLSKEKMEFETGNQFSYNQTNYWLLTMIIEKITGETFEDYILNNQFSNSKDKILFSSNSSENIPNRIVKNFYNTKTKRYEKTSENDGLRAHSGNGVNITLQTFLNWSINLDNNVFFNLETKKSMWKPFEFNNKKDLFGYGWDITKVNSHDSYGFSGGNVSAFRNFPDSNLSIIVLSNGYRYAPVQDQIINHIAGLVDKNLIDNYLLLKESIISEFLKIGNQNAEKNYQELRKKHPEWNFEKTLNSIGYVLIGNDRLNDAIKVFELNVKENQNSGDAFDSLGEGYFIAGKYKISKKYYLKSLELNPKNENARKMLLKIENQTTK
ncbi:serine hydrolase [Elizabethkingia meningoseptica]|uniref:serine hydrolase n=1 Tax=Elizabethkingia meningoseptica TaxID=238 RepID=UPI0023B166BA|nr:serine hydrolase [Elizabethkingia meningoseptica]MDE5490895.1 serine hydrolase [Elizabethkingia meningoseptica]